jgi:hypothetical protein
MSKKRANEQRFGDWEELADGGRRYFRKVEGRYGWSALYVKVTDSEEETVAFWQEIYDDKGNLKEIHHKFPEDTGHQIVEKT